jgi:hypothetical protein
MMRSPRRFALGALRHRRARSGFNRFEGAFTAAYRERYTVDEALIDTAANHERAR